MILSNVIVTGLELMIVGSYIYLFVEADSEKKQQYYKDLSQTNFAFKILPSLDFFLRFLIQMIFISSAIQIFTSYIKRRTFGFVSTNKKGVKRYWYVEWCLKRIVQFDDWYFSFEYQIPFTLSIFTFAFLLSNAIPLILGLGALFFAIKFYIEFKERLLYQHLNDLENKAMYPMSKSQSTNFRDSIQTFLLVPAVLYFGITSVFYGAQTESHK